MEGWQVVLLVIGALLAGALLPAIVQLWLSLRAAGASAERLAADAAPALAAVTATARRLDRLTAKLEEERRLDTLLEGIDSLSRTIVRLNDALRVASALGAAVGPAISAAVRSWSAAHPGGVTGPEPSGDGAAVQHEEEGGS
jgi:hypothetical protein